MTASATDIITYIGVPLAVLGVLPLLWNASSALRTWWRLKKSIPLAAQKLFRFRIDPVMGRVICAFNGASLEYEALLYSPNCLQPPQKLVQVAGTGLITDWMALFALRIPINTSPRPYPKTFAIDSSLGTEFTPLETDWKTFVYLALAMGCDPYNNQLARIRKINGFQSSVSKIQLPSTGGGKIDVSFPEGPPVVRLVGPTFIFSLRAAFAWELIMVIPDTNHTNLVHYLPLVETFAVHTVPYATQGLVGLTPENHDVITALVDQADRSTIPQDKLLELSLVWILYTEEAAHQTPVTNSEVLHTPQEILQSGLDAFSKLQALSTAELSASLTTVFPTHENLRNQLTDTLTTGTIDPNIDLWPSLQTSTIFTALLNNYNPLPTLRTPRTIDLTDTSTPEAFLAIILLAFSTGRRRKIYNWNDHTNEWAPGEKWEDTMLETGEIGYVTQPHPLKALFDEDNVGPPRTMYFA